MTTEDSFLAALAKDPGDGTTRLIFADWLEERGDPRGEILRLAHHLTQQIDIADRPRLEERLRVLLATGVQPIGPYCTNEFGIQFALIPPGQFLMGSPETESHRSDDEKQHSVIVSKGFWLATHPLTQATWQKVMGYNPSHFQGPDLPVEKVSWVQCQEFCKKLHQQDGQTYRLPTEAEWEYACAAGTTTAFHFGSKLSSDLANFDGVHPYGTSIRGKNLKRTTKVCSYPPNAFGLHDMHGNVWEWCDDVYGENYDGIKLGSFSWNDPRDQFQASSFTGRVYRGGGWNSNGHSCRTANRNYLIEEGSNYSIGFRVAMEISRPTRLNDPAGLEVVMERSK